MAETLGSLVDKLTIKDLRLYHLNEMSVKKVSAQLKKDFKKKIELVKRQKDELVKEIDAFMVLALQGKIKLKDEKVKLYNPASSMGRIPMVKSVSEAISGLANKNLELWHLEDEARRKDVALSFIGKIKRKIDLVNQQRNDFIDKIDLLFEEFVKASRR